MFAFKSFVALALPLLVVANPLVQVRNDPPTTCNSGSLKCCNQTMSSSELSQNGLLSAVLGLLGIAAVVDGLAGLNCDPITVVGAGSTVCQQETVCCTGNNFGPSGSSTEGPSLISFDCSPINIDL